MPFCSRMANAALPDRISFAQARIGDTILAIDAPELMRPVTSIKAEKTRSRFPGRGLSVVFVLGISAVDPLSCIPEGRQNGPHPSIGKPAYRG